MKEQRDVILGMATGYAEGDLRPFIRSLALTGFRGRLVLFVYARQAAAIRAMAEVCAVNLELELVRVRSIREHAKFWRSCIKRLFAMLPAERAPSLKRALLKFQGMPHVARHFYYDDYLRAHPEYVNVMLTDVRDVVFQNEPFAELPQGLCLGMENAALTIATEPYDREWMLGAYGETLLAQLGDKQISCAGVVVGDAGSMRIYLDKMLREILRLPLKRTKRRNYDQAHHNKLLHCGELVAVQLCQPLRSRIATVGCLSAVDFVLSAEGMLLNEDGLAAPVVHQYDRHPVLVEAFLTRISA